MLLVVPNNIKYEIFGLIQVVLTSQVVAAIVLDKLAMVRLFTRLFQLLICKRLLMLDGECLRLCLFLLRRLLILVPRLVLVLYSNITLVVLIIRLVLLLLVVYWNE